MVKFFFFIMISTTLAAQHNIIPTPKTFESNNDFFNLDVKTSIIILDPNLTFQAELFASYLRTLGQDLTVKSGKSTENYTNVIIIGLSTDKSIQESYELNVNGKTITLYGSGEAGVFNGFQTLKQLIDVTKSTSHSKLTTNASSLKVKGCIIKDAPSYAWRGLMLDVSRHFFSVDDVKAYLDKMAEYKFNVFHWHLSDDQGWRVEIKSLPKLTSIGAWAVERNGKHGKDRKPPMIGEKATYGGFYTQDQIKDIVKYAAQRNITVVPEIDMPGHCMAILAAYPELSVNKKPKMVNPGSHFIDWFPGGFKALIENTLNPADEKVYEFVNKVMTELAPLFPGEYIHMGGDECYKGFWERDKGVQAFMKKNGIKDSHELQSYFVKRVQKIVASKGKKLMGWDEILEGGLAEGAAVMSWRGMKGGIEAAKLGHKVVMSPTTFAYLDYSQGDHSVENKIYADLSLKKAYEFNPLPQGVDKKYILGGQGNLWTEEVPNMPFAMYMTYPRAFAIAESVWADPSQKDWTAFTSKVMSHFDRFEASNTSISKAVQEPIIGLSKDAKGQITCALTCDWPGVTIHYTIDNTYPLQYGTKYTSPFLLPEGNYSLRAQSFKDGQPLGRMLQVHRSELVKRKM